MRSTFTSFAFALLIAAAHTASAADAPPLQDKDGKNLPPIAELAGMKGNAEHGGQLFGTLCVLCHQIDGKGIDFGPNLSEVGSKLTKDLIFQSILDPSAVIEPGFEMVQLKLESEEIKLGIVASENDKEISLKAIGGAISKVTKADVVSRTKQKLSAMPAGLQRALSTQDLVDVVEYLSSHKKK